MLTSNRERCHRETKSYDHSVGHVDESLSTSTWVEVGLVNIVGEDGGDCNQLGR